MKVVCKGWNVKVQETGRESESGNEEEREKISCRFYLTVLVKRQQLP